MKVQVRNITLTLDPRWTGTATGYRMAYLNANQKRALGLPNNVYAIRIDGKTASLVKCVGDYTAHKSDATILAD